MGTFLRLFGISSDENRIDQATGLTERQKKLVQNTWAVIRKDENLKEVILEVLRQALGKQFTPEVAEAWSKTLDAAITKIYELFSP